GRWLGAALLAAYAVAYAAYLNAMIGPQSIPALVRLAGSLFGRAPLFLFGIAAAWLYDGAGERLRARMAASRLLAAGGGDVALAIVLTALGLLLGWASLGGVLQTEQLPVQAWHLLEGALWTAVVLLVLLAPLRTKPLFCNGATRALGVVSYSVYVVHFPLVMLALAHLRRAHFGSFIRWTPETFVAAAVITTACLTLSTLTYYTIERPFLVRKSKLKI
ncbi:MAG TPA: hypothetical protein VKA21_12935, partial [Candidatus Binatia bacterium]|nr:hypothetical protein [Candidatus Binatia bacterium]